MLAITLMNVLPSKADLMSPPPTNMTSTDTIWEERNIIKDLVERFTIAIYSKSIERQSKGVPVKIGATQMLWELHFVALRRWGKYSLLAGHRGSRWAFEGCLALVICWGERGEERAQGR
jgi:hypothetical protein